MKMHVLEKWAGTAWTKTTSPSLLPSQHFRLEHAREHSRGCKIRPIRWKDKISKQHIQGQITEEHFIMVHTQWRTSKHQISNTSCMKHDWRAFVSLKGGDIAKTEDALPPMWVRKEETPQALHEDIQRIKMSAWYIAYKMQGPVTQPKLFVGVEPAYPEQLKAKQGRNVLHRNRTCHRKSTYQKE